MMKPYRIFGPVTKASGNITIDVLTIIFPDDDSFTFQDRVRVEGKLSKLNGVLSVDGFRSFHWNSVSVEVHPLHEANAVSDAIGAAIEEAISNA